MAIQLRRKRGSFTQDDLDQLIIGQPAIDLDSGTMVVGDGSGGAVIVGAPQVAEEKELREEADSSLQADIANEAEMRENMDNDLQAQIGELEASLTNEKRLREEGDSGLAADIAAEENTRLTADEELRELIEQEAAQTDVDLDTKVDKSSEGSRVYCTSTSGEQMVKRYSYSNINRYEFATYDGSGRLVSKTYDDNTLLGEAPVITELNGYTKQQLDDKFLINNGVSYVARESNQTSIISNGRLKATDADTNEVVNVTKWGQIEPMGFTARYNTGKGEASYQQTTVCINPNEVTSIPEGGNEVTVTDLRITPSICYYNEASQQFSICLGLMGYSNIVPGSFVLSTTSGESHDNPSNASGELVFVEGDAMTQIAPLNTFLSYSNARILLTGVNDISSDIDDSEMFVTFKYKQLENYLYLPNKTGTLALKSDLPVFTADGDTLYIDLPE